MKKLLIAVVEDDLDDSEFICSALSNTNNIEIMAFPGAHDFFSFLKVNAYLPDLVITDLRMPLISGFDVIKHMKADDATKNTRVIVLSTSSNMEDIETAKRLGAEDYFVKPYNLKGYEEIKSKILKSFGLDSLSFSAVVEKIFKTVQTLTPASSPLTIG